MREIDFGRFRVTKNTVRRPVRETFEPAYTVGEDVYADLRAIERADQDLQRYHVDDVTARRLLEDALTRNAYGTASIEGNPLTLEDVESLLARTPAPNAVDRPEEREILNYVAWTRRMDAWDLPDAPEDVLALHRTLFTGVLHDAGAFKDTWNFIGRRPEHEVVFVPAAPERVRPELANAIRWLRDADEHPLVRIMVFFHEVQSIHPFRDGNGRTGRALSTLALNRFGYAGVRYALVDYAFNADRPPYYEHLALVERNGFDYSPWIRYMARVLRAGFEGAVRRFLFRDGLPDDLLDRQVAVAEWFAAQHRENPMRRVKFNDVHHAFPHVPARTLKRDLARLREAGVVEMQGQRKAASYRLAA